MQTLTIEPAQRRARLAIDLIALATALLPWLAGTWLPPLAQPQSYHDFADQSTLWGIPHALDVLSNFGFIAVGLWGLFAAARGRFNFSLAPTARSAWLAMFVGLTLTGLGSAFYHWAPSDPTLVWDRLPMALAFSGLVAGTLADRTQRAGWVLLVPLVATAVGSVIAWAISGNLVPYLAVQVTYVVAAIFATATLRSPYTHAGWLFGALGAYAGAFACERLDVAISNALGGVVSGHTLKHLLAAAAVLVLGRMLELRRGAA